MTTSEVIQTIKKNKIGSGCKLTICSNKIFINYTTGKTLSGQYNSDIKKVKELFASNVLNFCCKNNSGGINIWID